MSSPDVAMTNAVEEVHAIMSIAVEDRALTKDQMDEWVTSNVMETMDKTMKSSNIHPVELWKFIGTVRFAEQLHKRWNVPMPKQTHWNDELTQAGLAIGMAYIQSQFPTMFDNITGDAQ